MNVMTQLSTRGLAPVCFLIMAISVFFVVCPVCAADQDSSALERRVHILINAHRATLGLDPLGYSEEIAAVARRHSQAMATGQVGLSHEGVEMRRKELSERIIFSQLAENVAANNHTSSLAAQTAIAKWLKSSGHRQNLEGPFDLTGVGIVRTANGMYFFTQIFVSSFRVHSETSGRNQTRHRM
jgi:uncharacterized protein YkwD